MSVPVDSSGTLLARPLSPDLSSMSDDDAPAASAAPDPIAAAAAAASTADSTAAPPALPSDASSTAMEVDSDPVAPAAAAETAAADSAVAAASPAALPAAEPAEVAADAAMELDDDALIEAALRETAELEAGNRAMSAAAAAAAHAAPGDATDDDEEEDDTPLAVAAPAAVAAASDPAAAAAAVPFEGETYISESGEVMRRRAPRKKKVVELTEQDIKDQAEQKKLAAERAEALLNDLLRKCNEVMQRTSFGGGKLAEAAVVTSKKRKKANDDHRRKSEREEDEELLGDLQEETLPNGALQLRVQPSIVMGNMRPYQLEGLNWMIRLYHSGVSGVLADEMGLGKTLQSISLLAYLRQFQNLNGPHLVLVPLSTLGNWHREFTRWCPSIRCFKFHGTKEERAEMVASGQLRQESWDVLLTSYEMSIREKVHIQKVKWNFIIVDEAHRLKNENSLLSQIVRLFSSRNRLLLTGTPLQNNLHELWALLNFLLPDIFASGSDFDSMFSASEVDADVSANLLAQLHKVLRPFMLRRLKAQVATDLPAKKEVLVYAGMSEIQTKLYRGVLERDIEAVLGKVKEKSRLMNIIMQLRKVANHPYLFEGVEDRSLPPLGEHLISTSGKMVVLDKLLTRFKQQGSRVLIFSQMTRTLDIMEDVMAFRQHRYCRIDGSTSQEDREVSMREFNADGSEYFVFLLSTRAGGLGINLNTADIVILYDSDWNPQMDLQAMDRAHRIGQKKKVFVYRLVTRDTVEEKIIERAEIKLRLDAMVKAEGKGKAVSSKGDGTGAMSTEDVSSMIRFGADRIFRSTGGTITDADIDTILLEGEQRTQELASKLGKHVGLLDLSLDGASSILPDENQGELPLDELERQMLLNMSDSMGKRDRKVKNYDVDARFRDQMATGTGGAIKTHLPKPYKLPRMADYQLYNTKRIQELSELEKAWFEEHALDADAPAIRGGLTADEDAELQRLLAEGFIDWVWADYGAFIDACKRYGGKAIEKVVSVMEPRGKTREQVVRYHTAFFEKAPHLPGFKSALEKIARGESRAKRFAELEDLLERLLSPYPQRIDVMERMEIHYPPMLKGRGYTLAEDRFLLYWCRLLGYGEWAKLRSQIRRDPEFRFDYFLKSRTGMELNRRVDGLLRAMKKEEGKQKGKVAAVKPPQQKPSPSAATSSAAAAPRSHAGTPSPMLRDPRSNLPRPLPMSSGPSAAAASASLSHLPPPSTFSSLSRPNGAPPPSDMIDEHVPLRLKRQTLKEEGGHAAAASDVIDSLMVGDAFPEEMPLSERKKQLHEAARHGHLAGGESLAKKPRTQD